MDYVIGIDIGGTNLRIGTVYENFEIKNLIIKSSSFLKNLDASKHLVREIKNYLEKFKPEGKLKCITIGVPSCVSKNKEFIYSSPNLGGLENINLKEYIEENLNIKVILDRDVNYLLINDVFFNNLDEQKNKTILGMYLGTGFGNSIYIDGKIFTGKNGVAGELGHIPMFDNNELCTCGNIGCVETRVSGRYLKTIQEKNFPDVPIEEIFKRKSNDKIIKEFISNLSRVIAVEVNILDPDYVILSGGVMKMDKFPFDELLDNINSHLRKPYPCKNIEYIFTKHNQEAGVLGGAINYFKFQ